SSSFFYLNYLYNSFLNITMALISYIISQTKLPESSVKNTVELLNEDATIPFISRYRKEKTGNLDEVQIGTIVKLKEQFETFEKRKSTILKAIEELDALTPELKKKIEAVQDLTARSEERRVGKGCRP